MTTYPTLAATSRSARRRCWRRARAWGSSPAAPTPTGTSKPLGAVEPPWARLCTRLASDEAVLGEALT
jgi:hypothetical protein